MPPGQGLVPVEEPQAEAPGRRAAGLSQEEQERRARVLEEERAKQWARAEATRIRRNLLDRTRYHGDKMVELEVALAMARRRGQNLIVADILEDMERVRARATEAG